MKILFAYFGQPRYVYENIPNHIVLMKQIKNAFVSYEDVEIDILFATTPMDDTTVEKVENIIPVDMDVKFDFISELDRADIATNIHSKLKSNYFYKPNILGVCLQIISIHMLASKIDKEYDAVYVWRTDILFNTYKSNFDFSFLPYFIDQHEFDNKIYVTNMSYVISQRMPPIHVNDRILLTKSSTLKDLYFTDFENNVVAYLDDSYTTWGDDTINQINDYHSTCVRFLSNSFNSNKLKSTGDYYMIKQYGIAPPNSITRCAYSGVQQLDIEKLNSIINHTEEFDKTIDKTLHIQPEWFADRE